MQRVVAKTAQQQQQEEARSQQLNHVTLCEYIEREQGVVRQMYLQQVESMLALQQQQQHHQHLHQLHFAQQP